MYLTASFSPLIEQVTLPPPLSLSFDPPTQNPNRPSPRLFSSQVKCNQKSTRQSSTFSTLYFALLFILLLFLNKITPYLAPFFSCSIGLSSRLVLTKRKRKKKKKKKKRQKKQKECHVCGDETKAIESKGSTTPRGDQSKSHLNRRQLPLPPPSDS